MIKKFIALVLVLGVIGAVVGCSGGGEEGPAPTTPAAETKTTG